MSKEGKSAIGRYICKGTGGHMGRGGGWTGWYGETMILFWDV